MQISEAIELIKDAPVHSGRPETWADFGCGNGVFTKALAHIIPDKSLIYAIDKSSQYLSTNKTQNVSIDFIKTDFVKDDLALPPLDGVLMGNSLHYVADKNLFLRKLVERQPGINIFIIIEYDIHKSNTWVPYPVKFQDLKKLFTDIGYNEIVKLAERRSVYQRGNIYACSALKK